MFPNFRLMAVTVLAAIVGIGCGLGLFATFRVNHEPLARLSGGGGSVQIALNKAVPGPRPPPLSAGYPVDDAAKPIAATSPPAQRPASVDAAAIGPTGGETDVEVAPKPESQPNVAVAAPREPAGPPAETAPAPDSSAAAEVAQGTTAAPTAGEDGNTKSEQKETTSAETTSAETTAAVSTETPGRESPPGNEEGSTRPAQNETATMPATDTPTGQAAPVPSITDDGKAEIKETAREAIKEPIEETSKEATKEPVKEAGKETKKRVVKAVQPVPARRAARPVLRRTQAAAYQSADLFSRQFSQSAYQWADTGSQAPQTVRRVVMRQRRFIARRPPWKPSGQSSETGPSPVASGVQ